MRQLQYHSTPSATPSSTTMDMILDALEQHGFRVVTKAAKEQRGLRRIAVISADGSDSAFLPPYATDPSAVVRIGRFEDIAARRDICAPPAIAFAERSLPKGRIESARALCQERGIALACPKEGAALGFGDLISVVSNYLVRIGELEAALAQILKANGSFQDMVSAVEPFFERYIAITDANDALIARTYGASPDDPVNASLVDRGFHLDRFTKEERNGGPVSETIDRQKDIAVYKPRPPFPYCLITHAVRVKGSLYAYIVMTCPEQEVTDGLLDSFCMLAQMCDRLARRKVHGTTNEDHILSGFLAKLFTEGSLDRVFLREQADRLQIPTHGMFTLASISIEHPFRDQLEHVARRIDRSVTHRHWMLIEGDRIRILFHADTWDAAMDANVQLSELQLDEPYEMLSSDVYEALSDTHFAFRQIAAIERYLPYVRRCRMLTGSKKHDNVFAFHDVFCFYWEGPFADDELRGFAMDHTRLSKMEHDDERDGTNNVPLLNAYLILERKATQVGELFHMHRNGVIYRIDKIEKTYRLDLDDYLTRQYLQICARIKLIATNRFTIIGIGPHDEGDA